jgi:hypothetical protein
MFRTQLASTISAARHNPAPTFWVADASSTTPAPPQAYAGSLQPSRQNSLTLFVLPRVTQGSEEGIMGKALKNMLLAAIATAVLCVGTVSARQLQMKPKLFPACTGTCEPPSLVTVLASAKFLLGPLGDASGTQGRSDHRKNSLEADASASAALFA